jgi:hypothetical protein
MRTLATIFRLRKDLDNEIPYLSFFNLVADMLVVLLERAKANGDIRRVIPHLVDDGLSILQYADDTILVMQHDLNDAKNFKLVLSTFFSNCQGLKSTSIRVNSIVMVVWRTGSR